MELQMSGTEQTKQPPRRDPTGASAPGSVPMVAPGRQVKPPRRDARPRMLDTSQVTNQLRNKVPGFKYLYCPSDPRNPLLAQYESRGWKVVYFRQGGVCPMGNLSFKEGDPIIVEGSVLLALDEGTAEQHFWYGSDGSSGQDLLDELDKQITQPGTYAHEQLRTVGGYRQEHIGVQNQSTHAGPEVPGASL